MTHAMNAADVRWSDLRVLVVDDEPDLCRGMVKLVQSFGAQANSASSAEEALLILEKQSTDIVISDIKMTGMTGIELMRRITGHRPGISVILVTGFGTIEMAVSCLQQGAAHFLTKPFDNDELVSVVKKIGRQILLQRLSSEGYRIRDTGLLYVDPNMAEVMDLVAQVAGTKIPVLISGESGTGKELVARTIHARSAVSAKPFLAVNCAALPDTLLESELFGYKRGAFTGASKDHQGLFRQAAGGTVFLDEVPSMSLSFQGKLLRVLQEKVIRPLGSTHDEEVDFRLIASTNMNLKAMVERGEFREDLFYRLGAFSIDIPPLRNRPKDIPFLVSHFLATAAQSLLGPDASAPQCSSSALAELCAHNWPGNVRELENTVQRAVIVCRGTQIQPHDLLLCGNAAPVQEPSVHLTYDEQKQIVLDRFQRQFLQRILEQTRGNISRAADACGLTRAALQKMMRRLQIEREDFADGGER